MQQLNGSATDMALNSHLENNDRPVLGLSFEIWLKLQGGQEKITRFGGYLPRYGQVMRHQNGHEHRCSVCFLFTEMMIRMRPFCELDELMLTRCINHHDEPEGIIGVDVLAPKKKDEDDLREYLVFEELYKGLGEEVWKELQRSFLLQFCIANPACFPEDARAVMSDLAVNRRYEALFFDAVQRLDYLYYAYECYTRGLDRVLHEVAQTQIDKIEAIAPQLPGFDAAVWTEERAGFFKQFANQLLLEGIAT